MPRERIRLCASLGAVLLVVGLGAAQEAAKDEPSSDFVINGQVVANDPIDPVRKNPAKVHAVTLIKGRSYQIDLVSSDFDAYMRIEDAGGRTVAEDDDGGAGLNARVKFTPPDDATYKIYATTFAGGTGNYTLTVRQAGVLPVTRLQAPLPGKDIEVVGQLNPADPQDLVVKKPAKAFTVELAPEHSYQIDLRSAEFDSFLRLTDAQNKQLAKDDDSGGNLNSRILFTPPAKGTYRIIATSFDNRTGGFQLSVKIAGKAIAGGPVPVALVPALPETKIATPTADKAIALGGQINANDPLDPVRRKRAKIYTVELDPGSCYQIDLVSDAFDAFLRLTNDQNIDLGHDDDGGGGLNSRLTFVPATKGLYRIVATTLDQGTGGFQLSIKVTGKAEKADAAAVREVGNTGLTIGSALTGQDALDRVRAGSHCQVHQVKLAANKNYSFLMLSGKIDSFLRLEDAKGNPLAEDDDSGGGLNARIAFRCVEDGVYRIITTTLERAVGPYVLVIREE